MNPYLFAVVCLEELNCLTRQNAFFLLASVNVATVYRCYIKCVSTSCENESNIQVLLNHEVSRMCFNIIVPTTHIPLASIKCMRSEPENTVTSRLSGPGKPHIWGTDFVLF